MQNAISICGKDIQVKEYNGQRVVTFRDIDNLHQRPEGTARRNFNSNKKHFTENEDFFVRNSYEAKVELGIVAPNGLVLLTESGYLLLVKSLNDDLAWQVQKELINNYFRAKDLSQLIKSDPILAIRYKQLEIEKKLKQLEEQSTAAHHRIDNIDKIDTLGDLQQRLNAMVRKYAHQEGLTFSKAWNDFIQAFNTAYRTNLNLLKNNYQMKHGIRKLTTPEFLSKVDRLEDAIRVADKMLNRTGTTG